MFTIIPLICTLISPGMYPPSVSMAGPREHPVSGSISPMIVQTVRTAVLILLVSMMFC